MDLVFQGIGASLPTGKKDRAINEDCEDNWEGTKGRYCTDFSNQT